MIVYKLGEVEMKFADLIWENQPIPSGKLVKLAADTLVWKKSTTYTVLRKLCKKGFFTNENGAVSALVSKEEYLSMQSEYFLDESFSGSLPKFIASFSKRKKLSNIDILEIQSLIDNYKGVK